MRDGDGLRPLRRERTWLRRLAGRLFYRFGRYFQWYLGRRAYALGRLNAPLAHEIASHRTPLIRNLPKAELWMQRNKAVNLRLAVEKLDGVLLRPGETFSFWRLVGRPAKRRGYLPGMVLQAGRIVPGVGGGLCQLTNLIYWMALHTDLTVTERHRHSYDVFPDSSRTQPFGSGATCAYNYLDLQIHNGTGRVWQLKVSVGREFLEGCWRSDGPCPFRFEVAERDARILDGPAGGCLRHNTLWQMAYDGEGRLVSERLVAENNALMLYPPYLAEGNPGADATKQPFSDKYLDFS